MSNKFGGLGLNSPSYMTSTSHVGGILLSHPKETVIDRSKDMFLDQIYIDNFPKSIDR